MMRRMADLTFIEVLVKERSGWQKELVDKD
jgi:hypothetical protein